MSLLYHYLSILCRVYSNIRHKVNIILMNCLKAFPREATINRIINRSTKVSCVGTLALTVYIPLTGNSYSHLSDGKE